MDAGNSEKIITLSPRSADVRRMPLWELHSIQGHRCRMKIRVDAGRVLSATVEHDDMANAPSFTVVEIDGEWQLAVARVPYTMIEDWVAVERCVKDVQELWEENGKRYLQNFSQWRAAKSDTLAATQNNNQP